MIVREAKCGEDNRFLTLTLPPLRLLVDLPTCSKAACWQFVCAESVPTLCACRDCAENTVLSTLSASREANGANKIVYPLCHLWRSHYQSKCTKLAS